MLSVQIDAGGPASSFKRFWRASGFSPGELLLTPEMRATLAIVGGTPGHGVEFLRPHYMLELVRASRDGYRITSDWSLLDRAVDTMVEFGFRPVFEFMGNPSGVFIAFHERDDILMWRDFVSSLVSRFAERYGADEVRQWYFETWNEPDAGWWSHDIADFMNYYDGCVAGVDAIDPSFRIGGPGTCRTLSPIFKAFLAHCDSGVSSITGDGPPRLDFISIHEKGVRSHLEDLTPDTLGICTREMLAVDYVRTNHPRLSQVPFINNECDPQTGWRDTHTWNATSYVAALMARIIDQHQKVMIEGAEVPYDMLANDNGFIGSWGHRTQLTYFGDRVYTKAQSEFVTNPEALGRVTQDTPLSLVKKPSQLVMEFLGLLGEEKLSVAHGSDQFGVIPTRHPDGRLSILAYNSIDSIRSSGHDTIALDLVLPDGQFDYAIFDIDGDAAFGVWEGMGAPEKPSDEQIAQLRRAAEAVRTGGGKISGRQTLELSLRLPSVKLILISPEGAMPQKPERRWLLPLTSINGNSEAIVGWKPMGGFATYTISASHSPEGPFTELYRDVLAEAATVPADAGQFVAIQACALDGQTS